MTLILMLDLINPLEIIINNKPRVKIRKLQFAKAETSLKARQNIPIVINIAPMEIHFLCPRNLSAKYPPISGVRYTSPVYHPYILPAF